MADVQRQFQQFDEAIRLRRLDENATLREKRDRVLASLADGLSFLREEGRKVPKYDWFHQGSYEMGTGVLPVEGDYDIDIGLRFDCPRSRYKDPVELKELVYDALVGHTQRVEIRRSCVTVYYQRRGEPVYHVDLAIYAQEDKKTFFGGQDLYIAKGKRNSETSLCKWEASDPLGLVEWVKGRFDDSDDERQFLRVIRALKRWKGENFRHDGASAPTGIALTVAAGRLFEPSIDRAFFSNRVTPNDLEATLGLVDAILDNFETVKGSKQPKQYRLVVKMPVGKGNDLCARMTTLQMTALRQRFVQLKSALQAAEATSDAREARRQLAKEFGPTFPAG